MGDMPRRLITGHSFALGKGTEKAVSWIYPGLLTGQDASFFSHRTGAPGMVSIFCRGNGVVVVTTWSFKICGGSEIDLKLWNEEAESLPLGYMGKYEWAPIDQYEERPKKRQERRHQPVVKSLPSEPAPDHELRSIFFNWVEAPPNR